MTDSARKILLVDDVEGFLKVTRIFLERNGYEVQSAQSGEEALALLADWQPDALLIDVQMPQMSGFELIAEIRERELCPKARIMIVTGRTDPLDASKARSRGARAILYKPYSRVELLDSLKALFADE